MHIKSLTALLTLLLVTTSVYSAQSRPNIVVILSDDAGYTDLGSFGGEIDTPNLDALAEKGLKLSNFYSNARCSPTRATLLSGVDAVHEPSCNEAFVNGILCIIVAAGETNLFAPRIFEKNIRYENIHNIRPENYELLVADIKDRTGLDVKSIEILNIDFLSDIANLKVLHGESK